MYHSTPKRTLSIGIGCCVAVLALACIAAQQSDVRPPANDPLARQPDFLPVDDAFVVSATRTRDQVVVGWDMPAGYYLYRHAFAFAAADVDLGTPDIPDGKRKTDEFFGDTEVYYGRVEVATPIRTPAAKLTVRVTYQGCADYGLCYPPQHRSITFSEDGATAISKAKPRTRAGGVR